MTLETQLLVEASKASQKLLGGPPENISPITAGANSRIYKVGYQGISYALKRYPLTNPDDPRDRQGCERRALELMIAEGISTVPHFIVCDQNTGYSLLEWIDGGEVSPVEDHHIVQAGKFIQQTALLPCNEHTMKFPLASEACLSGNEVLRQVATRRQRLIDIAKDQPILADFFTDGFTKVLDNCIRSSQTQASRNNIDMGYVLDQKNRRLIPADFGFHNSLRLKDGSLRFIDFEYFGWDDPVKLSVDFLIHPSVNLTRPQYEIVLSALNRAYIAVPDFKARLKAWTPMFIARWALIMLNVFLPSYQKARAHIEIYADLDFAKKNQIEKVTNFLQTHSKQWGS